MSWHLAGWLQPAAAAAEQAPPPPPPPPPAAAPQKRADGRIIATPYAKKLAKVRLYVCMSCAHWCAIQGGSKGSSHSPLPDQYEHVQNRKASHRIAGDYVARKLSFRPASKVFSELNCNDMH